MSRPMDLLADFTLDVWLLARFSDRLGPAPLDGRTWERAVAGLLHRPGFTRRQGPGTLTLFGSTARSGVAHEIDSAAGGRRGSFIIECKTTGSGISKGDAAIFHYKVMDFYERKIEIAANEKWWRFLCGAVPTPAPARAAAIGLGLLVCDPARLPLPVLVRAAGRPAADMHLPETLLQEIVRLGERALCCHQDRWPYRPLLREIGFNPHRWRDSEIQDLLWLEDELSGSLLDLYEKHRPGVLERRAMNVIWQARKTA
ncbi:hypothetical protein [Sinorhizobium fredii]|uniref:hypothetical protein n=1 Tax=Rhizobium fredii TaxID=380 RepID=UPI003518290E